MALEAMLSRCGGTDGVRLMGEVAELGSDLTLWAVNRFAPGSMRSALGALLLFDSCHSMMRGFHSSVWADRRTVSWNYYWDHYAAGCLESSGRDVERARRKLRGQVSPQIAGAHRIMAALASEPSVESWRRRWVHAIETYLYRADRTRISRRAQQLTMMQSRQLIRAGPAGGLAAPVPADAPPRSPMPGAAPRWAPAVCPWLRRPAAVDPPHSRRGPG